MIVLIIGCPKTDPFVFHIIKLTCTCDRSLSLNWTSTCRAPSSLNSFKASIALSSRSLCATRPDEHNKQTKKEILQIWFFFLKKKRCNHLSSTEKRMTHAALKLLHNGGLMIIDQHQKKPKKMIAEGTKHWLCPSFIIMCANVSQSHTVPNFSTFNLLKMCSRNQLIVKINNRGQRCDWN